MFFRRIKEHTADTVADRLMEIAQYILFIVFGFLPIFFIPWTSAPLTYTKVGVVFVATLVALVCFCVALLRTGSVRLRAFWSLIALWGFVAATLISALFSGDRTGALLGDSFEIHTFGFVALIALVATAWMFIGTSKSAVMRLYVLLSVSTLALVCFHITRLVFGQQFLALGLFGDSTVLSPIGAWNNLALFFGLTIILSLIALEQLTLTIGGRVLFAVVAAASLTMLAVVNLFIVWLVLGFVSLVVLVYAVAKDRLAFAHKGIASARGISPWSVGIALLTLVVSVLFVISGSAFGAAISKVTNVSYVEVRPSLDATIDIARAVYQDDALLGVGPNRFMEAWRLHREREINDTVFWNTDFNAGIGYVPTFFVTTGLLGGIALSAFILLFVFSGIRFLIVAPNEDRVWYFIGTSSFAAGAYLWVISIFYVPGPVLLLLAAMCTGIVYAAHNALVPEGATSLSIGTSPRANLILIAGTVLCIAGSIALLYVVGQHYTSVHYYTKGLTALSVEGNINIAEERVAQAYSISNNDLYARRIAEYEGSRLAAVLSATEGTQEERQTLFQTIFNNGVGAARTALAINSKDADNWSVLGTFYASVVRFEIEGVYEEAKNALEQARTLDPQNPSRTLALAQLALIGGQRDEARTLVLEALRLKPNYSDAMYTLSQIDILNGNVDEGISAARSVVMLEPQNPVRYFQLGVLELSNNNPKEAVSVLEYAVTLNPEYANARYFLAFAYDAVGRTTDARAQLQHVLALNPGNPQVTELLTRLDGGESISKLLLAPQAGDAAVPPVSDVEDVVGEDGAVSAEDVPDSPLLTPVNIGAQEEGEPVAQ